MTKNPTSTVVCSEHFSPDDFTLPLGYGGGKVSVRRRLRPGVVPSVFSFSSSKSSHRPTPAMRRSDAEARLALVALPKFGPMTALQSCEDDLKAARSKINECHKTITH